MLYVEGLKHNMLGVSQMCDNGYDVTFLSKDCEICNMKNGKLVGKAIRTHNNVYVLDDSRVNYCLSKTSEARLWHKRLGHMNFESLIKVSKMGVVRDYQEFQGLINQSASHVSLENRLGLISSQNNSPHPDLW